MGIETVNRSLPPSSHLLDRSAPSLPEMGSSHVVTPRAWLGLRGHPGTLACPESSGKSGASSDLLSPPWPQASAMQEMPVLPATRSCERDLRVSGQIG